MNALKDEDPLLTSAEVAQRMRVNPRTVTNWVREGKLTALRIHPAGRYRFRESDVRRLLYGPEPEPAPVPTHEAVSKFYPGWQEWCPQCSCGWTGSYVTSKQRADLQAQRHVEEKMQDA